MNTIFKTLVLLAILSAMALADTLVLKNGLSLEGKYKGGTETTIMFETSGKVQEIALSEVKSLAFSAPESATQTSTEATPAAVTTTAAATAAATPAKEAQVASGTEIPAGTKLMIITTEEISTAANPTGSTFRCALESDLLVDGSVVAAKDSEVYGKVIESVGGRRVGNQHIMVTFDKIKINDQLVEMETDEVGAEGGRGGAARAVGAGALIGAAAGDAAAGAAVGGAVALLAGGKHIQIPADTVVEVALKQAISVP